MSIANIAQGIRKMDGRDANYTRHFWVISILAIINGVFWAFFLAFATYYDVWPIFWMMTFWVVIWIKAGLFIGHAVHRSQSLKPLEKTLGKVSGIIVIIMAIVYWIFYTNLLFNDTRCGWYLTYFWLWLFELIAQFGAPFLPMVMIVLISTHGA